MRFSHTDQYQAMGLASMLATMLATMLSEEYQFISTVVIPFFSYFLNTWVWPNNRYSTRRISRERKENTEDDIKTASRLTSLHCGHCDKLRMRRCLTILQSGLHFPLCCWFYSSSQFGSNTDGRVHSAATKHALPEKLHNSQCRQSFSRHIKTLSVRTLGELYVCQRYGPPSRWCRALLFQRHLTRTQPGSPTVKRPDTCPANGERSSALKRPLTVEATTNPSCNLQTSYFVHREELLNEQKKTKKKRAAYIKIPKMHSFKNMYDLQLS